MKMYQSNSSNENLLHSHVLNFSSVIVYMRFQQICICFIPIIVIYPVRKEYDNVIMVDVLSVSRKPYVWYYKVLLNRTRLVKCIAPIILHECDMIIYYIKGTTLKPCCVQHIWCACACEHAFSSWFSRWKLYGWLYRRVYVSSFFFL